MGVLLLAGIALIAYTIVKRAANPEGAGRPTAPATSPASTPAAKAPRPPYGLELPLPAGARLLRATPSGERLIVELELAAGGERLLVVDLASGVLVGMIDLKP